MKFSDARNAMRTASALTAWETIRARARPMEAEMRDKLPNSKLQDVEFVRKLVKRIMDDGRIGRLEACNFAKLLFDNATGLDVLHAIDGGRDGK